MSALSKLLRAVEGNKIAFYCPGCKTAHVLRTGDGTGPKWEFNGNVDSPTFQPSVLVRSIRANLTDAELELYDQVFDGTSAIFDDPRFASVCHSFVRHGQIEFLPDCTHELVSQTVPLPDFPHSKWEPTP